MASIPPTPRPPVECWLLWSDDAEQAGTNVSVSGGFDFDQDGTPDLALTYQTALSPARLCGRYPMGHSFFSLVRGATGAVVSLKAALPAAEQLDLCWDFRDPSNPVQTKQCDETQHCVCKVELLSPFPGAHVSLT